MLQKFVSAGVIAALLASSALAQAQQAASPDSPSLGVPFKPDNATKEDPERRKAVDRAYEAAMRKIPDKKAPADPWGDIRPGAPANAKNKQP